MESSYRDARRGWVERDGWKNSLRWETGGERVWRKREESRTPPCSSLW